LRWCKRLTATDDSSWSSSHAGRPPAAQGDNRHAPANTLGIRHVAFVVEDINAVFAGLRARGAELVGELERYRDIYRLCYVRGPEGIIVELVRGRGTPPVAALRARSRRPHMESEMPKIDLPKPSDVN
jgi:hypothetical protein